MASYERYREYASALAASWAANNPVLPIGQVAVESDTGRIKVGDGSTAYTSLPYGPSTLSSLTVSDLTASRAVFTDANKKLVSNNITGSGNVVMSASPTLTGTMAAASATFSGDVTLTGANGESTLFTEVTQTLTAMSGATVSATSIIPANSILLGVTTRVITEITGCTSIKIGTAADDDAFGDVSGLTAGSTTNIADHTVAAPAYYGSATSVVITAVGDTDEFTAGAIRVTAHYIRLTAATN
jgi:hypothetical protein